VSKLALLLGTYSADIAGELQKLARTPHVSDRLRAGVPVDLLRRRPDIRAAERQLAAATARVGGAIADLFPTVAVTAGFGAQGGTKSGVAVPIHNPIWSFGPGGYWPLLDFGKLGALINIQEMRAHEQFVNYKKTIVSGGGRPGHQAISARSRATEGACRRANGEPPRRRPRDGALRAWRVTDFLNVLDAQRQDYVLEDQNAVAEEVVVQQYIAFYKALGGGWELYDELPPQPAIIATARRLVNDWH
jgi:outer membrane protein TolC